MYSATRNVRASLVSIGTDRTLDGKYHFEELGLGLICYVRSARSGRMTPCIITVKHLIYDPHKSYLPNSIRVRFPKDQGKDPSQQAGINLDLVTDNAVPLWFSHNDQHVDLVCIPLLSWEADSAGLGSPPAFALYTSSFPDSGQTIREERTLILGTSTEGGKMASRQQRLSRGKIVGVDPMLPEENLFQINSPMPEISGSLVFSISSDTHKGNRTLQIPLIGMITGPMEGGINPVHREGSPGSGDLITSVNNEAEPAYRVHQLLQKATLMLDRFLDLKWDPAHKNAVPQN